MTDHEFRERLTRLEAGAEHRAQQQDQIAKDVRALVADMNERRGRDAAAARTHVEDREDRWQTWTWIRAFLPTGVLVAVWTGILELLRRMVNGETP